MEPGGQILAGIDANRSSSKGLRFLFALPPYFQKFLRLCMKACKKADGKRGAEGAIGPYQDFGRNRSKTFFFKKPFDSYLPLQFSDLPMALQQDRSRGGGHVN